MARMYPLFSSSSGNCTYIGDEKSGLLVDAGVSCKRICAALDERGIPESAVGGILITHIHSDHISGLKVLSKRLKVPVYSIIGNLRLLEDGEKVWEGCAMHEVSDIESDICGFGVTAFETPHDTPVSCGFRITAPSGESCAVCTDLGEVTDSIHEQLRQCRLVLLESNYDEDMLKNGPYPWDLKKRIASGHGHLSNKACAAEVARLVKEGVYSFVLGHISQHNNTPKLAESCTLQSLSDYERGEDYLLTTARPDGTGRAVIF